MKLLSSYLRNRSIQAVRIGSVISDYCHVSSGVPQGSILGSLLFILFINHLPEVCINSRMFLYADDGKCLSSDLAALQSDLENCISWANKNSMTFNASKTVLIRFSYTVLPCTVNFSINCIHSSLSVKDLGVHVASDLNWSHHIQIKLKNCYVLFIYLKRSIPSNSCRSLKIRLYHIYLSPALLYGCEIWSPNATHLLKLERYQSRVLSWCVAGDSYRHRMMTCGVFPVSLQIQLKTLLLLNKLLHNLYDFPIYDFIIICYPSSRHYNTRGCDKPVFVVPKTKRHKTDMYFMIRATKWAKRIQTSTDISLFNTPSSFAKSMCALFWTFLIFFCAYSIRNPYF